MWVDGLPAGFRDFGVFASRSIKLVKSIIAKHFGTIGVKNLTRPKTEVASSIL
jgi:hypothetical protein